MRIRILLPQLWFSIAILYSDLDPGTEILVRRSPQVGGKGKRIPKPDSYEDLLRAGGAALGIKAVRKTIGALSLYPFLIRLVIFFFFLF